MRRATYADAAMEEAAGTIKGRWTDEEDDAVRQLVAQYGATSWSQIASLVPGTC